MIAGPPFWHLAGRRAGTEVNFTSHSPNIVVVGKAGLIWDAVTLERFLADSETQVPGTLMKIRLDDAIKRQQIITFLHSLKP